MSNTAVRENGRPRDLPDLVVFSDDWGRHPSSCQHLVSRLFDQFNVFWVNTIGTRAPRLDLYTLQRGFSKIAKWSKSDVGPASPNQQPRVLNPTMWPSFGSSTSRWLNGKLLRRSLEKAGVSESSYFLTTIPVVADLVGTVPAKRWIYYCVDDLSEWPGLDKTTLLAMEGKLLENVDEVVAVSENLVDRLSQAGIEASLLTHGVDLSIWTNTPSENVNALIPELAGLEKPFLVFWGLVDRRLNTQWIEELDRSLEKGSILLVGPENTPDPALAGMKRVHRIPAVDYQVLPVLANEAAVLIMPYSDLPVTRAMQPLKFKEYLATYKPTVASNLPAIAEWQVAADVVSTAEEFVQCVKARLLTGLPEQQRHARGRLSEETWEFKAQQLANAIRNPRATPK